MQQATRRNFRGYQQAMEQKTHVFSTPERATNITFSAPLRFEAEIG
jgi:hypothetical protein